MTVEKLTSVLRFYSNWLDEVKNVEPVKNNGDGSNYPHLMWMCESAIEVLIPAGNVEKAMRWLGFVQGALCARGDFTVDQLREQSREDPTTRAAAKADHKSVDDYLRGKMDGYAEFQKIHDDSAAREEANRQAAINQEFREAWVRFAAAYASQGSGPEGASVYADELLKKYEKRFTEPST